MAKQTTDETVKATYTASELIRAGVGIEKDVLSAVLQADGRYTVEQAKELVKRFLIKGAK